MKTFMDKDFLLTTETSKKLFDACKDEPIFDWHCHLQPKEIYENLTPRNITALWLDGDHYKWRAMRSCGIEEKYITGDASDYDKFCKWAETMPNLIGHPLYHWTHLELQRYFGITETLSPATCDLIWKKANDTINNGGFKPRELIEKSHVYIVCTTDDAADTLEYHKLIAEDKSFKCKVIPAFRPDKALAIDAPAYQAWVESLIKVSGESVTDFTTLKSVLLKRIEFFASMGTRASDHALTYVPFLRADESTLNIIVKKALSGNELTRDDIDAYKTELMRFLAAEYAKRGWGMEIHIGAMRNNNSRMFKALGPDTGYDSIDDYAIAENLSRLLDSMECDNALPRTILFTLNPKDNYVLSSMLGNFQSNEAESKIQFGTAWWFNDNYDGMREQIKSLANGGALAKFIGMVTDSRSFLSYPRHEYFRRIVCEFIGDLVEEGKYPNDLGFLCDTVKNISYGNAFRYFFGK